MELLIDKDIINNIELLIEVYYFLNDGYSDLNVQIIEYEDSLRFDATTKSVNVNLIMYNYDHLRMYSYSVSPS